MSLLLIDDCYSRARSWGAALTSGSWSGGTVSVANAASLRDPVLGKPTTVTYSGLPVASGANAGRFGPLRLSITGATHAWSGNAWALLDCGMPDRTRIEWAFYQSTSTIVLAGADFPPRRPGAPRNLAFYSAALDYGGIYANNFNTTTRTLQIDFYLPFAVGSFSIGRLFIGHAVDVTAALDGNVQDRAIDYAAQGASIGGLAARRWRGVGRQLQVPLTFRPGVTLQGQQGKVWRPLELLETIGQSSHVVFWPGATLAAPTPASPSRLVCGLLRTAPGYEAAAANDGSVSLDLIETL